MQQLFPEIVETVISHDLGHLLPLSLNQLLSFQTWKARYTAVLIFESLFVEALKAYALKTEFYADDARASHGHPSSTLTSHILAWVAEAQGKEAEQPNVELHLGTKRKAESRLSGDYAPPKRISSGQVTKTSDPVEKTPVEKVLLTLIEVATEPIWRRISSMRERTSASRANVTSLRAYFPAQTGFLALQRIVSATNNFLSSVPVVAASNPFLKGVAMDVLHASVMGLVLDPLVDYEAEVPFIPVQQAAVAVLMPTLKLLAKCWGESPKHEAALLLECTENTCAACLHALHDLIMQGADTISKTWTRVYGFMSVLQHLCPSHSGFANDVCIVARTLLELLESYDHLSMLCVKCFDIIDKLTQGQAGVEADQTVTDLVSKCITKQQSDKMPTTAGLEAVSRLDTFSTAPIASLSGFDQWLELTVWVVGSSIASVEDEDCIGFQPEALSSEELVSPLGTMLWQLPASLLWLDPKKADFLRMSSNIEFQRWRARLFTLHTDARSLLETLFQHMVQAKFPNEQLPTDWYELYINWLKSIDVNQKYPSTDDDEDLVEELLSALGKADVDKVSDGEGIGEEDTDGYNLGENLVLERALDILHAALVKGNDRLYGPVLAKIPTLVPTLIELAWRGNIRLSTERIIVQILLILNKTHPQAWNMWLLYAFPQWRLLAIHFLHEWIARGMILHKAYPYNDYIWEREVQHEDGLTALLDCIPKRNTEELRCVPAQTLAKNIIIPSILMESSVLLQRSVRAGGSNPPEVNANTRQVLAALHDQLEQLFPHVEFIGFGSAQEESKTEFEQNPEYSDAEADEDHSTSGTTSSLSRQEIELAQVLTSDPASDKTALLAARHFEPKRNIFGRVDDPTLVQSISNGFTTLSTMWRCASFAGALLASLCEEDEFLIGALHTILAQPSPVLEPEKAPAYRIFWNAFARRAKALTCLKHNDASTERILDEFALVTILQYFARTTVPRVTIDANAGKLHQMARVIFAVAARGSSSALDIVPAVAAALVLRICAYLGSHPDLEQIIEQSTQVLLRYVLTCPIPEWSCGLVTAAGPVVFSDRAFADSLSIYTDLIANSVLTGDAFPGIVAYFSQFKRHIESSHLNFDVFSVLKHAPSEATWLRTLWITTVLLQLPLGVQDGAIHVSQELALQQQALDEILASFRSLHDSLLESSSNHQSNLAHVLQNQISQSNLVSGGQLRIERPDVDLFCLPPRASRQLVVIVSCATALAIRAHLASINCAPTALPSLIVPLIRAMRDTIAHPLSRTMRLPTSESQPDVKALLSRLSIARASFLLLRSYLSALFENKRLQQQHRTLNRLLCRLFVPLTLPFLLIMRSHRSIPKVVFDTASSLLAFMLPLILWSTENQKVKATDEHSELVVKMRFAGAESLITPESVDECLGESESKTVPSELVYGLETMDDMVETNLVGWVFRLNLAAGLRLDAPRELDSASSTLSQALVSRKEHEVLLKRLLGHQIAGVMWILSTTGLGFGCALADEMGLGKTLQALACIALEPLPSLEANIPSLVLVQPSFAHVWVHEASKHFEASLLDVHLCSELGTSSEDRLARITKLININDLAASSQGGKRLVFVCTYQMLVRDIEFWAQQRLAFAIADEGHILRNQNSEISRAVRRLVARRRLLLSGTPLQRSPAELYSIFSFLCPGLLGNPETFRQRYTRPILKAAQLPIHVWFTIGVTPSNSGSHQELFDSEIDDDESDNQEARLQYAHGCVDIFGKLAEGGWELHTEGIANESGEPKGDRKEAILGITPQEKRLALLARSRLRELALKLRPFCLRRLKRDILTELPEKSIVDMPLELTPAQHDVISELLDSQRKEPTLSSGVPVSAPAISAADTSLLMKATIHIGLVRHAVRSVRSDQLGDISQASPKFNFVLQLLKRLANEGDSRLVVFSQSQETQSLLRQTIESHFRSNPSEPSWHVLTIDGSTPQGVRAANVAQFQRPIELGKPVADRIVLLLTTRSGGLGLTLTAASTGVMLEHDENPLVDLQAMDRLHRIGQTRKVTIYRLLMRNTFEEDLWARQNSRLAVAASLMASSTVTQVLAAKELELSSTREEVAELALVSERFRAASGTAMEDNFLHEAEYLRRVVNAPHIE